MRQSSRSFGLLRLGIVGLGLFSSMLAGVASAISVGGKEPLTSQASSGSPVQSRHPGFDPSVAVDRALEQALRRRAEEERIRLEEERKRAEAARIAAIRAKVSKSGLSWPHLNMITSHFGPRRRGKHHGMDILCSKSGGEPIYAAAPGRVISATMMPIYGRAVIVQHGPGTKTLYAHMWKLAVRNGQWVNRGAVLGWCGSTGNSTNPHLHFEFYQRGRPVNPLPHLPSWT